MLYTGMIFITLGVYFIFEELFDMKAFLKERKVIKKEKIEVDSVFKLKFVVACFAIILGILSLINYFS